MTDKAQALIDELVSAAVAFGRGQLADWQTRIEDARVALREYITEIQSRIIDAMAERTVLLIESGNTIGRMESRIAELEGEVTRLLTERDDAIMAEARYIAKAELAKRDARIAELEAEIERLSQLLHDEMSQLEIATDLANKRWVALNKIYEDGEKHNTNWCKRIAQEGLGIKNA